MALKNPKSNNVAKNDFPPQPDMEAGTYPARLVQIIDLGLQPQRPFKNEPKAPANEVMLTYEFVDCFMVDEDGNDIEDKPRWFSETIPWYGSHEAVKKSKGYARYKAFDPNNDYDGDLAQCIDTPVNVTIVINKSKDKTYVNIASITAMRPKDAAKCPELVNPTKTFDLDEPDMEVFGKLPTWLQDKLKGNLNYAGSVLEAALSGGDEKQEEEKPAEKPKKAPKPKPEPDADDEEQDDVPW